MDTSVHDVIVVGAGPAGLSAAWALRHAGLTPLVLEQAATVGASWRAHYDGLRLNTGRVLSRLPGSPLPRSAGGWQTRDELVKLLEGMPARGGFAVQTGINVTRIDRRAHPAHHVREGERGLWQVHASHGVTYSARAIVMATGGTRIPIVPTWEGQAAFRGRVLHSSEFRRADEFAGQRVLVVGCGNSAAEIASRLSAHASAVICAVRTPPHLLPKSVLGIPMAGWGLLLRHLPARLTDRLLLGLQRAAIGDLSRQGLPLPRTRLSVKFGETNVLPTLYEPFSADVRAGRIRIVGTLKRFTADGVIVDERVAVPGEPTPASLALTVDSVILGTGFRSGLESLIDVPGIIAPDGRPRVSGAQTDAQAPGLHFIGQTNPLTGQLREIRREAEQIARALQRQLSAADRSSVSGSMRWRSHALRSD